MTSEIGICTRFVSPHEGVANGRPWHEKPPVGLDAAGPHPAFDRVQGVGAPQLAVTADPLMRLEAGQGRTGAGSLVSHAGRM